MKVVQINTYYGYGSTGKIVKDLEKKQLDSGIQPYILYGKWDTRGENKTNAIKINTKIGYYFHKIQTHLLGKHGFYSKKETTKAVKILDELNPDIIHLHNLHGHYINVKILIEYIIYKDIPVVWTFHDCWPFTGHCAHFFSVGCEKWKNICVNCPLKYSYPRSFLFDRSKESFIDKKELFLSIPRLQIVTVSDWLNSLVKQSIFKERKVRTIHNWIDTDVFFYRQSDTLIKKYNLEGKFIILGVAASWTKNKGIDDFIKLSEKLDRDEQIVLVGEMSRKNLPSNILSVGVAKNQKELVEFYSMADVYVNLSKQETFGLTTAEAMSCGTPVIVYNITACPEVIGNENCGYTVDPGNIDMIYMRIKDIKRNGKEKYSHNCIQRVKKMFNKEDRLNEYIEIYNQFNK